MIPKSCRLFGQDRASNQRDAENRHSIKRHPALGGTSLAQDTLHSGRHRRLGHHYGRVRRHRILPAQHSGIPRGRVRRRRISRRRISRWRVPRWRIPSRRCVSSLNDTRLFRLMSHSNGGLSRSRNTTLSVRSRRWPKIAARKVVGTARALWRPRAYRGRNRALRPHRAIAR